MVLLKDHTQVGMAWQVAFTLDLFFVFSPNKLKILKISHYGAGEWSERNYPKPISKDNNVEILSFCIYNIINKHVVTGLNPVVISC